jgi:hypothetical protein
VGYESTFLQSGNHGLFDRVWERRRYPVLASVSRGCAGDYRAVEVEDTRLPLSEPVESKISDIRVILDRNSLTRLVRLANAEENFVSNFAGESHRVHWDLLRRTGFDPLMRLGELLDGPYDTRQVGDQTWYIWPDFAAQEAEDLLPEKLDFADRARLRDLVGDVGLERIRGGEGYSGIRTAIAEDGRWLYFVHETVEETQASE